LTATRLKSLLTPPLLLIAAVCFLIEEVLWGVVADLAAALGRWPLIARLEAAIGRLPPYAAMLLFVLPWAVILPVKLVALWLLATGHPLVGVALFAGGELVGVGFLARIYALCRPALATLGWFVRLESFGKAASTWAHDQLDRFPLWRLLRQRVHGLVLRIRRMLGGARHGWLIERMRAARRRLRMQMPH
jgi:hypothetical protein